MPTDAATLQTVLDLSPLATATLNVAGDVTRWNAAAERLLGWTRDEMFHDRQPMACGEAAWLRHQSAVALHVGCLANVTARRPRRDGSFVSVTLSVAVIRDVDGHPEGFVAIYTEDERERKQNGLPQLAAGIALEVNSPSQYIGDNLTFLRDAFAQTDSVLSAVGVLRRLIADEADPSRIWTAVEQLCLDAERTKIEDVMVEIPQAIAQSMNGVQFVCELVTAMKEFSPQPHNVRVAADLNKAIATILRVANNEVRYVADIHTRPDPDLPPVWCLPGQINQVLLTLLVNAAQAINRAGRTPPDIGVITVSTRKVGASIEIEVSDTGTGIPESAQLQVFDPFFAGVGSRLNTGHGLALAHATIVNQHRGRIWFESEVGKGTSFFVRLPLRNSGSDEGSVSAEWQSCASL
jgi:PAS domain S-box-containing protein